MVLNNVTKFHKILIKTIRLRELTLLKTVNFHKQRAITAKSMVRYGPLSNLKKISRYLTMSHYVTKYHKILIKNIRLRERTSLKMVNFHRQNFHNYRKHGGIWTIIKLEEDIMLLNNVTKFHKILIKNIRVRERTLFKTVNFHKQSAITTESLVQYGPLSNLKKT